MRTWKSCDDRETQAARLPTFLINGERQGRPGGKSRPKAAGDEEGLESWTDVELMMFVTQMMFVAPERSSL